MIIDGVDHSQDKDNLIGNQARRLPTVSFSNLLRMMFVMNYFITQTAARAVNSTVNYYEERDPSQVELLDLCNSKQETTHVYLTGVNQTVGTVLSAIHKVCSHELKQPEVGCFDYSAFEKLLAAAASTNSTSNAVQYLASCLVSMGPYRKYGVEYRAQVDGLTSDDCEAFEKLYSEQAEKCAIPDYTAVYIILGCLFAAGAFSYLVMRSSRQSGSDCCPRDYRTSSSSTPLLSMRSVNGGRAQIESNDSNSKKCSIM
jgi:hypothetical protein